MKNTTNYDRDGYEAGKWDNEGLTEKAISYVQDRINSTFKAKPDEQIWVRSNYVQESDFGDRIAFTEKSELHPNGEAFIAGAKPQMVALTENVALALNDGVILPCSPDEVQNYEAERIAQARKALETKKESYKERYIAVFETELGFEQAFEQIEKRIGLAAAIEVLR